MHRLRTVTMAFMSLALCAVPATASYSAPAQVQSVVQSSPTQLLAQLSNQTNGTMDVAYHAQTGKVRFLSAGGLQPLANRASLADSATAERASRSFLARYGSVFGLRDQANELALMKETASYGSTFVRFQQQYQGVPIMGGEVIVQTDAQRNVVSVNGELQPDLNMSVQPTISAATASSTALAALAKQYGLAESALRAGTPALTIFNPTLLGGPGIQRNALAWRMEISSDVQPIREVVLVDAHFGFVALHFNQMAPGKERHICDDKNAVDPDSDQTNNCTSSKYVRNEGQGATGNSDIDKAYDYSGITYDYFKNNFGRDSIDGKGMPLISLVRYCPDSSNCPYENAFWDGQQMTYGAGFASADDVVAHELSHGVTEHTSHLFYYYQSGAINESMSDVFGELMDLTNGIGNDAESVRWKMGEDLPASIGIIRDMKDPTVYKDPDRTGSTFYYGGTQDNGGVHSNSGVNNKAAYLMTDGGTFNGQTITGLGATKTGAIYYIVESSFLTSASDYQDMSVYLPASCYALVSAGAFGMTNGDCAQVEKVVAATEMATTPTNAKAPEASMCTVGLLPADSFYDNMENPSAGVWKSAAVSGSVNAWYYPANSSPYASFFDGQYATSGVGNIWGYDYAPSFSPPGTSGYDYAIAMTSSTQVITTNTFLHFRHSYDFDFSSDFNGNITANNDGGVIEYSVDNGTTWQDAGSLFAGSDANGYNGTISNSSSPFGGSNSLKGRNAFVNVSKGYVSSRADLSSFVGKSIRFRFRIGTDAINDGYGWFIDDVRIYSCSKPSMFLPMVGR